MSEQRAAALELLTHRREGAQIAGGGLHLLGPELVLAQFGEAFRGCFLGNPAKEITLSVSSPRGRQVRSRLAAGGRRIRTAGPPLSRQSRNQRGDSIVRR